MGDPVRGAGMETAPTSIPAVIESPQHRAALP
jgi:hypothetical protein